MRLAHGSGAEERTRVQLLRLIETYDVSPWLMTRVVAIDEETIPHSHPVLTLHTRHLANDDHLLSTFLHEQMHWWLDTNANDTKNAVLDLQSAYPKLPVGFPEGADTELSSYEHLVVIYLEYAGLEALVGPERARATFEFWGGDHYRALYRIVKDDSTIIEAAARRHRLFPIRSPRAEGSASDVSRP